MFLAGCIQQALALDGVGQDDKLHARVKCNTCVMRSRSLHRKMTTKQDRNNPSRYGFLFLIMSLFFSNRTTGVNSSVNCRENGMNGMH